jgi:hypothetical protein
MLWTVYHVCVQLAGTTTRIANLEWSVLYCTNHPTARIGRCRLFGDFNIPYRVTEVAVITLSHWRVKKRDGIKRVNCSCLTRVPYKTPSCCGGGTESCVDYIPSVIPALDACRHQCHHPRRLLRMSYPLLPIQWNPIKCSSVASVFRCPCPSSPPSSAILSQSPQDYAFHRPRRVTLWDGSSSYQEAPSCRNQRAKNRQSLSLSRLECGSLITNQFNLV